MTLSPLWSYNRVWRPLDRNEEPVGPLAVLGEDLGSPPVASSGPVDLRRGSGLLTSPKSPPRRLHHDGGRSVLRWKARPGRWHPPQVLASAGAGGGTMTRIRLLRVPAVAHLPHSAEERALPQPVSVNSSRGAIAKGRTAYLLALI